MNSVIVADTSVIINGYLADQIESGSVRNSDIIIPQAVFDELQSQASNHKQQGFIGLEQIQKLNKLSDEFGLKIILKGSHPSTDDIRFAASGRIDALIIDIAKQNNATLYTSDKVQHLVAQAEDVKTIFLKHKTTHFGNLRKNNILRIFVGIGSEDFLKYGIIQYHIWKVQTFLYLAILILFQNGAQRPSWGSPLGRGAKRNPYAAKS